MKKFILATSLITGLLGTQVFGETDNFQEGKTKAIRKVEERMAKLGEMKTCIESATDWKAIKACHDTMKAWNDAQQAEQKTEKSKRKKSK